jgi:hypothetical protein
MACWVAVAEASSEWRRPQCSAYSSVRCCIASAGDWQPLGPVRTGLPVTTWCGAAEVSSGDVCFNQDSTEVWQLYFADKLVRSFLCLLSFNTGRHDS